MENEFQKSSEIAGATAGAMLELLNHIDGENSARANVLIGIGAVLLTLVLSRFQGQSKLVLDAHSLGLLAIALGALTAIMNAVFAFKPSIYSPKRHLSLFYPGSYLRRLNEEAYTEQMVQMFQQDRTIVTELSRELYNYGGIVMGQAKRIERSIYVLIFSIVAGAFVIIGGAFF